MIQTLVTQNNLTIDQITFNIEEMESILSAIKECNNKAQAIAMVKLITAIEIMSCNEYKNSNNIEYCSNCHAHYLRHNIKEQ